MTSMPTRPERPIENKGDDKLGRSRFIERLTEAVVNAGTGKSTGVVIGITGPWGSGKSSILNLLHEHIEANYENALVVRFDPWLVSGRNDLIGEFFGELIGTINANQERIRKFKELGTTVAEYGAQLAPIGDFVIPGVGQIFSGTLRAMKKMLSERKSLNAVREKLVKELEKTSAPIVVLIDEIDRVEDDEIRVVAQLVRSVADFPGISYVIAYDPERVIQALGSPGPEGRRDERGKSYLEKIVQLQIPLPVTLKDEISHLLTADLKLLANELQLAENFENIERYQRLVNITTDDVIYTLRDVRRLVGTFHVLRGMLIGEVDWIDLLAYSAVLIKAPQTVEKMRREPEDYLVNPVTARGITRRLERKDASTEDLLDQLISPSEKNEGTTALLQFLFPSLNKELGGEFEYADGLRERRPLLSTLRLGLLPSEFSREDVHVLVSSPSEEVQARLHQLNDGGSLDAFTDRLDDLYVDLGPFDHVSFWRGVGEFAKKPDCEWMSSYQPMHEIIREFSKILVRAVRRSEGLREEAAAVFNSLRSAGESELTAHWLRRHIFVHGLLGNKKRDDGWFLDAEQTEILAREMSLNWRSEHLAGQLIPCRWSLDPVFTIVDAGLWDEQCCNALDGTLVDDRALDGFTLMVFGGDYATSGSSIAKLCNHQAFVERAIERLQSAPTNEVHETVRAALKRAVEGDW